MKTVNFNFNKLKSMRGIEIERALDSNSFYIVTWEYGKEELALGCDASIMAIETLGSIMPNGEYDKTPVVGIRSATKMDIRKHKNEFLDNYGYDESYVKKIEEELK